ncbi:MAG TPA: pyridoxamine 5'-phosphate oxidase family protein [Solirubrobacterales bacterium]|nr:pyridoxamine 5'-phosphate oxidase family protein [Solirubrobacterales bacterium]
MAEERDTAAVAREIVDRNLYLVLATADLSGQPWASPVYFAHRDYRDFFWVSEPDATHSVNLRDRREVGIVIFDSTVAIGSDQAVYVGGVAQELPAHETAEGRELFSRRSAAHGGSEWTDEDVRPPSRHRLFQATAEATYVLDEHDHRVEVDLH